MLSMLSGVSIICFAASYGVTLALEVTRLFFRSGIRGAIMVAFAGAGLFAHTVYLYYRAVSATGSPLSSRQDWCMVAAWVLAVTYLYLMYYHPKAPFGLFILPLVLGLIAAGTYLADPEPFPREPASRVWGTIHAVSILLATVAVLVGFAAGLMYLGQARRLKHKLPPQRALRLPSLEWLQRANSRAIGIAVLMLGAGILSGAILNLIDYRPEAERLPWSDPVVLSTLLMFVWLVLCTGVGLFYRPAREGHRVALFTLFTFVFLAVALALVLLGKTQHGGTRASARVGFRVQGLGFMVHGSGIAAICSAGMDGADVPCWPRRNLRPVRVRSHALPCICSPLTISYSPLTTHHSPLPTHHSPLLAGDWRRSRRSRP
jgi:ABC-type transport system involved in cytochrome c biogenesis permease subunit